MATKPTKTQLCADEIDTLIETFNDAVTSAIEDAESNLCSEIRTLIATYGYAMVVRASGDCNYAIDVPDGEYRDVDDVIHDMRPLPKAKALAELRAHPHWSAWQAADQCVWPVEKVKALMDELPPVSHEEAEQWLQDHPHWESFMHAPLRGWTMEQQRELWAEMQAAQ